MKYLGLAAIFLLAFSQTVFAGGTNIDAAILLKATTSWDGAEIRYPSGPAEISVVKVRIPKGMVVPLHCHPVASAGYISKGAVEVTSASGERRLFKAGQAAIETINTWHKAVAVGSDTEIIVFYAGQKGLPLTIKQDVNNPLSKKCD